MFLLFFLTLLYFCSQLGFSAVGSGIVNPTQSFFGSPCSLCLLSFLNGSYGHLEGGGE
jgi:hypothetical protein